MDKDATDALIDRIYEAGMDISKWQAVVNQLHSIFPYSAIALYGIDLKANVFTGAVHRGFYEDYTDRYERDYSAINPFVQGFHVVPIGAVLTAAQFCTTDVLQNSAYYNDWLLPQGQGGGVATVLFRDSSRILTLTMNCGTQLQNEREQSLSQVLEYIGPHLKRSFALTRQLAASQFTGADFRAALDMVPGAAFLLCSRGKPIQMNSRGEALLAAGTAAATERNGRLYLKDRDADRAMARALDNIAKRNYAGVEGAVLFPTELGLYAASLGPFIPETERLETPLQVLLERRPVAILTLTGLNEHKPGNTSAARHFHLSPAEVKLVTALADGVSLAEFSERGAISIHTARNQLKSVFWKTGTSRQSELVALFLRLQLL